MGTEDSETGKSWGAAGIVGQRQGQVGRAPPPWRCPLPPHNGPSSPRSSAGRSPAETLAQASPLRLSFPTCIIGEQVVVTRKRGRRAEHPRGALGQQHLLLQIGKPPVLLSDTKPALPLAPGPAEPGLRQSQRGFLRVNSPGGATAFSALITRSWELGPN